MSIAIPATLLDCVQRTWLEAGISGTVPTTTVGQTGEILKLVSYVASAWIEIQSKHEDWHWLRKSTSWVTVNGQSIYTPVQCGLASQDRLGKWETESFRNYTTSVGTQDEIHMDEITSFDAWRNAYLFGATRDVRTRPTVFAIHPADHGIALGPVPNGNFTVTADYYEAPVELTLDADVPALPKQHMMIIVYQAMMSYGEQEAAPEVYHRGALGFHPLMQRLERDRLKPMRFAGALA